MMSAQVPSSAPVKALRQARQRPVHARSQQTPSAQTVLWHSGPSAQGWPGPFFITEQKPVAVSQPRGGAQSPSPVHAVLHAWGLSQTKPPTQGRAAVGWQV